MGLLINILEHPIIYNFSQLILAPGSKYVLNKRLNSLMRSFRPGKVILDIGCGPESWLWQVGLDPVGLDISFRYSKAFSKKGTNTVTGSSTELPFKNDSVDGVWCIGLLHHLDDTQVEQTIDELIRIVSTKGYIVIFDAVLPNHSLSRPLASIIRKLDRGKFMRSQTDLESLISSENSRDWKTKRYTYAATGLEMLECYVEHPKKITR